MGLLPPIKPHPPPRGRIGVLYLFATLIISATCSVDSGRIVIWGIISGKQGSNPLEYATQI
ncbi:hypothetical protein ES703_104978 [subsurface metagenome]